jgi:hypothetical protein
VGLTGNGAHSADAQASDGGDGGDGGGPLTTTFAVSDHFAPTDYMGAALSFGALTVTINQGCKPRPAGARGDCYVFEYRAGAGSAPRAGVEWVFPANNGSGLSSGLAVDTTRFKQIRFYAALEGPTPLQSGGAPISLMTFAGGVGATDPNATHVDALTVHTTWSPGIVDATLRPFHVPLGLAMNCFDPRAACVNEAAIALIGAFGWSVPYPLDYLDDIVWDTEAPPP